MADRTASIALIGPWPRPYGGISVHVERLAERLRREGARTTVYDDTGLHSKPGLKPLRGRWVNGFTLRCEERVVHYHSHSWGVRMRLSLLAARGKRVLFTVHSLRREPEIPARKRPLFAWMNRTARFIAVNEAVRERLTQLGARRVRVIGPYISPPKWGEPAPEVVAFAAGHEPLVALPALHMKAWDGEDVYGLLHGVHGFSLLRRSRPRAGLLIYLSEAGDDGLYGKLLDRIEALGLGAHVLIRLNAEEGFHTCLSVTDLVVRATFTESFGLAVAEAQERGVRVLASDAAPRQEGVFLYGAGDAEELAEGAERALRLPPPPPRAQDAFEEMWALYRSLV